MTFAPGTDAPAVSFTVPVTRELTDCATAIEVMPPSTNALSRRERKFKRRAGLSRPRPPLTIVFAGSLKLLIVAPSFFSELGRPSLARDHKAGTLSIVDLIVEDLGVEMGRDFL